MIKKITLALLFMSIGPFVFAQSGAEVGDKAPPLSVEEWLKGEPVTSFESGKVYLVEFWGTWCGPCIKNIPHLSELQKKYLSQDLIVIGVATHEWDGRDELDKFMEERGSEMEYRVAYDSDLSMEKEWDTGELADESDFKIPLSFVIDKNGIILFKGHPENRRLESSIEKALNEE